MVQAPRPKAFEVDKPWWALPYPAAVAVWYLINVACVIAALHIWANALERARDQPSLDSVRLKLE
jgi:tryptophan-rich sensory protein